MKYIVLFFAAFLFLSCTANSIEDVLEEVRPSPECTDHYYATIADNCDCSTNECEVSYIIPKSEYNRLKSILENSVEECNWVTVNYYNPNDLTASGYLLRVNIKTVCV